MSYMKKISVTCAAAVLAAGFAVESAQAATIWATQVDDFTVGTGPIPVNRTNPDNALGAPDGEMVSLGFGGELVVSFSRLFQSPGKLFEITFGKTDNHIEIAEIFAGFGGVFQSVATIDNSSAAGVAGATFTFAGIFDQIKIVDISPMAGGSVNGFDVDAVGVTPAPIPLPAGGLLLVTALGGLALTRRRKSA